MRTASLAAICGLIMTLTIALGASAGEESGVAKAKFKAERSDGDQAGAKKPQKNTEWIARLETSLSKKVNVDFKDAPLSEAINFIQHVSGVSMILDPGVKIDGKMKLTIKAEKTEIAEVLDSVLAIANLERCYRNRALFITAKTPNRRTEKEKPLPRPAAPRRKKPKNEQQQKDGPEFIETPASQVVNYVAEKGKLNLVIDPAAIKLLEAPITFKAKGMKLGQVLDWALRLSGTEKRSVDGVIYIRPKKGAAKVEVRKPAGKGAAKKN